MESFTWSSAPLCHVGWPAAVSVAYVALSLGMASRLGATAPATPPRWLRTANIAHNVILVAGSALMFGGVLIEVLRRGASSPSGLGFLICADPGTESASGAMYGWCYVYYLSKYYELLDTPLQLLRGKRPPNFGFQVYHHALVLFMGWAWLEYTVSLWQAGMLFNTAVHVVMYYYFLLCTLGAPPKWKRWVTRFQVVQFVTSLALFAWTSALVLRHGRECAGYSALLLNGVFNVTLLYQFVGIARRGSKPRSGGSTRADGSSKRD